jgi:hypothetical protein
MSETNRNSSASEQPPSAKKPRTTSSSEESNAQPTKPTIKFQSKDGHIVEMDEGSAKKSKVLADIIAHKVEIEDGKTLDFIATWMKRVEEPKDFRPIVTFDNRYAPTTLEDEDMALLKRMSPIEWQSTMKAATYLDLPFLRHALYEALSIHAGSWNTYEEFKFVELFAIEQLAEAMRFHTRQQLDDNLKLSLFYCRARDLMKESTMPLSVLEEVHYENGTFDVDVPLSTYAIDDFYMNLEDPGNEMDNIVDTLTNFGERRNRARVIRMRMALVRPEEYTALNRFLFDVEHIEHWWYYTNEVVPFNVDEFVNALDEITIPALESFDLSRCRLPPNDMEKMIAKFASVSEEALVKLQGNSEDALAIILVRQQEGFLALYRGLLPKVMRLGPGGGIMLIVYESVYDFLRKNT